MALIEHCVHGQRPAQGSSAWVSFLSWLLSKIFTLCLSSKTVPRNQQAEGAGEKHTPVALLPALKNAATHPMLEPGLVIALRGSFEKQWIELEDYEGLSGSKIIGIFSE